MQKLFINNVYIENNFIEMKGEPLWVVMVTMVITMRRKK